MLEFEKQIEVLRRNFAQSSMPVLSIYSDVNPAKPENAGKAWLKRVKNAIHNLPEIRGQDSKRDTRLYDRVLELLESERPEARTLALFALRDEQGELLAERLDLQVDLPVVDLANGRVEARFGKPYLTPLLFAVDEYERAGVLHLEGTRWRFYEVFLGEIREEEDLFAEVTPEDWEELAGLSARLAQVFAVRAGRPGGRSDKLNPRDRASAKVSTWMQRIYGRLSELLDAAIDRLGIERLVLMGEHWQISHFEGYLSRGTRRLLVARTPHPRGLPAPTKNQLLERILPALEEVERRAELDLLDRIRQQPGLWGMDPVLDALQLGRVQVWVLPWSLEARIWRCEQEKFVAATPDVARIICEHPQEVPLRDYVWELAAEFGARVEFVRGPAEQQVLTEMGGMAALLRW
ncbi:MAG: VLRF1 family aeRF1-type release factor [Thermoleophilia bacterium]|nr:VLRF1 family aeRF1-type release factor [Thermoleophilia bacterium]